MNIRNWKGNFSSKIKKRRLIRESTDSYLKKAIQIIDIDESEIDYNDIQEYVCGKGISTEKYKLLRKQILQDKFNISTKVLTKNQVLKRFKSVLMELLFREGFNSLRTENDLVEKVMEQILTFNSTETKFIYVEKKDIDFQNIISVSDPEFMMDMNGYADSIDLKTYVEGLHFEVVEYKDTKCIEMTFVYDRYKGIPWDDLCSNSYIKCLVKYCETVYSWEDFIAESWMLYKSEKYKLAFLQFFVGFDAFIEHTIMILKKLISRELFNFTNGNRSKLKLLIKHMYVGVDNKKDDLSYLLVKYKRLCNDSRNLINEKFVDIIELNNYIHTSIIRDMFNEPSKYYTIKEKLNKLTGIRNDLAHGSSERASEDFQMHYLSLLSIFFEILLDFKDLKFDSLVV